MLLINGKIKNKSYINLVLYALIRCDAFSCAVPDFESYDANKVGSKDFIEYKNRIQWILDDLKPSILYQYTSKEYFNSVREYNSEIYICSLNDNTMGTVIANEGLYSWQYPEMPEDLCLFSKGKCWLKSIAHEKKCWIYTDNEVEKDILKKVIGLKFTEIEEPDIPALDYHM